MNNFFDAVSNLFSTVGQIIQHLFTAIIHLYNIIIIAINNYTNALLSIPIWLRIYGGITLTVCALYLVIGRESGK